MFNDRTNKKKEKITAVLTGAAMVALAATFGYATVANAQIQASVSKPVLRTEYKSSEMINLTGDVELRNGDKKISISLRESDLKPALRMIADKAGLNIIFHNSVNGTVTLDLVNVTLNDAFKMIMQACDLSYVIEDGTLIVLSKDAALSSDMGKQNMMTIPVKYADSAKVADFLNANIFSTNRPGLSNNKIVVTNSATNELVLFGTINDYKMAQKVVSKLDVAPKTISYRVNHTTPKEMATLICQSLFPSAKMGTDSSSSGGAQDENKGSVQTPFGAGLLTGGASGLDGASDSKTSGSGSGSSSKGNSSVAKEIILGEGKVACTVNGDATNSGNLKSLSGTSLTVTYFPQKGSINVTGGSDQQAEMIKNFILANDKKQPQAYVEVQVLELTEDGRKEFNNTWNIRTPFFSANFGTGGLSTQNPIFFTGSPYADAPSTVPNMYRYHGDKTLGWSINYLIENGKGRMLANPKVVVTNGKLSKINLTRDIVKEVEEKMADGSSSGDGSGGIVTVPIVSKDYDIGEEEDGEGVFIEMTPFISPDGYVTLNLKPSYTTVYDTKRAVGYNGTEYDAVTLLQRRNLDLSNVRIKDGETLVLGGMIQENEKKQVTKLPFLGDLPLIGSVFRNTSTVNEKTELVIMVTPHIIKDTEDALAETENL